MISGGLGISPICHSHRDAGCDLKRDEEALLRPIVQSGCELHWRGLGHREGGLQAEGKEDSTVALQCEFSEAESVKKVRCCSSIPHQQQHRRLERVLDVLVCVSINKSVHGVNFFWNVSDWFQYQTISLCQ